MLRKINSHLISISIYQTDEPFTQTLWIKKLKEIDVVDIIMRNNVSHLFVLKEGEKQKSFISSWLDISVKVLRNTSSQEKKITKKKPKSTHTWRNTRIINLSLQKKIKENIRIYECDDGFWLLINSYFYFSLISFNFDLFYFFISHDLLYLSFFIFLLDVSVIDVLNIYKWVNSAICKLNL